VALAGIEERRRDGRDQDPQGAINGLALVFYATGIILGAFDRAELEPAG
jgi:hypothetical protein